MKNVLLVLLLVFVLKHYCGVLLLEYPSRPKPFTLVRSNGFVKLFDWDYGKQAICPGCNNPVHFNAHDIIEINDD